jgi:uncharacterized membrane protein
VESKRRSFAKALSWRLWATIITSLVVWFLTKRFEFALTVGLIDTSIKLLAYFFHERLWVRIPYGLKKDDTEYHI